MTLIGCSNDLFYHKNKIFDYEKFQKHDTKCKLDTNSATNMTLNKNMTLIVNMTLIAQTTVETFFGRQPRACDQRVSEKQIKQKKHARS